MMKGGLGGLMKQAQQMQANMQKAQEALGQIDVEGAAGAGAVKVTMSCHHKVRRVQISDAVMDDREMLEDLMHVREGASSSGAPVLNVRSLGRRLRQPPCRLAPASSLQRPRH